MDLRRRTTHVLAAAGALLVAGSLSLGAAGATAVPRPAAEDDRATTTSSKPKKQKSKKSTTTTEKTTEKTAKSTSTSTTTTTTAGPTRQPASTATTRPTTTTTAPKTAPHQVDPATEPPTDGSTPDPGAGEGGDDPGAPDPASKQPTARSGSGGLPPGIYPGPGSRVANSTPRATSAPAPVTTVTSPPVTVAPADTQPAREGSGTLSEAGVSDPATESPVDPVTESPADPSVSGAELDRGESPAPARRSRQLGQTGDGTRRLILLGGVALLLGALVVAFAGRDRPEPLPSARPAGPGRRPRPRRELDGWEDGVPLAPAKRELARHRLGISASGRPGDGLPGAGPGA